MNFRSTLYLFLPIVRAQYIPSPRWAQAVALLDNTLYVHGGLSDPYNTYSYSSAPEISDLLVLDLSTSFNSTSPPWQLLSTNSSPALAWHTLSAFSPTELLLFGGLPGPNSLTVLTTLNDSVGLLSTSNQSNPSFFMKQQNWANEPMRRIRQSSSFTDNKVWITGGEWADGSGNAFSQQYFFNPSTPEFTQLPSSTNAPPDIYGHASFVLPGGRLLVLGGYCASCSELVPMNTVWSLDTTQNPPVWEQLLTSNESLPNPRRDFASVVLSNGQILVHGGGDAQLQTTYSDGWILDTGQDPMVWNNIATLTQLGERKDHFAVQAGNYVFFCFGYGSSAPAPATLFIYDPATSSMVTSYNAPPPGSTPAITSLPLPSQTGSNSNTDGGTTPNSSGGSSDSPSYTSSSSSNSVTAIVLGTVFGIIALVTTGLAVLYYMRKARNPDRNVTGRFSLLVDDPEFSSDAGSQGGPVPEAVHLGGLANDGASNATIKDILAHLGINKFDRRPSQPRKDMFADEDARSLRWADRSGTLLRQSSEGTSTWSFRSVSALVRGVIGRNPSGQGDYDWEKINHLREEDDLIRQGSLRSEHSLHLTHKSNGSFWTYTDPFQDPISGDECDELNLSLGIPEKDVEHDHSIPTNDEILTAPPPEDIVWPFSAHSRTLTPVREASRPSPSDPSNSLPSLQGSSHEQLTAGYVEAAALSPLASGSSTCYSATVSRHSDLHPATSPIRHSPITSPTLTRSSSISRPDSWWSRLTKSPLLDRRMSITSKPLDFRDPTPAPPLDMVEEARQSPSTIESSNDTPTKRRTGHGKSMSSAHSGRTANTDSAERLGGRYDVVQRLSLDGSSSRRVPSLGSAEITEQGMYAVNVHARPEMSLSDNASQVDLTCSSTLPVAGSATSVNAEVLAKPIVSDPTFRKRGVVVASRVKEYEHKLLSQESESQKVSPSRNTRRREKMSSRTRPTIHYELAPRASLFIANPDLGNFP